MQQIVFDVPYQFVPPRHSSLGPRAVRLIIPRYMRKNYGVTEIECRGFERLQASIEKQHGIVIAPNHPRPCDPMLVGGMLANKLKCWTYTIGSWHIFMQSRFQRWLLRTVGAFSIYREGTDKQSLELAIDILENNRRPLIIFAEGAVTRNNDILGELLEGTAFMARRAAKKREKDGKSGVVIHPIAVKYFFLGSRADLERTLDPVLASIERRLSWLTPSADSLLERIYKVGEALLTLKELEYFRKAQEGTISQRVDRLRERLFELLETEWIEGKKAKSPIARCKNLRAAILKDMVSGTISPQERQRRWRCLAQSYLAQQLGLYPPDYIPARPTPERILETVERMEEDLTDKATIHRPLKAVISVGEAIEVSSEKPRGEADPVMQQLRTAMEGMLGQLMAESGPPWELPPRLADDISEQSRDVTLRESAA
jgi:1-acyl-sn-glycerol-3-phosphate acyltransferase